VTLTLSEAVNVRLENTTLTVVITDDDAGRTKVFLPLLLR